MFMRGDAHDLNHAHCEAMDEGLLDVSPMRRCLSGQN